MDAGTSQRPPQRDDSRRPRRSRPRWNPVALDLAQQLRREIPALRRIGVGRIVPPLTRFALSPTTWTAEQLVALIWHVAKTKGLTTNQDKIRKPESWLAYLLRDIDDTEPDDLPADHPEHPDQADDSAQAVISPDDPWAATLLAASTTATPPAAASPARPPSGSGRTRPLWKRHERRDREDAAAAERAELRAQHDALRAELRREGLCQHGAPGGDERGFSPRCGLCRHQR